jgi:RNAse (barnase) inhibitor barstar
MNDWMTVLGSYLNDGVYLVDPGTDEAEIQDAAAASRLDFVRIDLHGVSDKASLLHEIGAAVGFPEYFGMNWDALYDCLTDMSWRPAAGYVLLLAGIRPLTRNSNMDFDVVTRVLDSAAGYWRQREVPFYALLSE